MAKLRDTLGKQCLKNVVTGIGFLCLGAAGLETPILSKASAFSSLNGNANHSYAALGKGPALQLIHALPGEDEDCVRAVRMVDRDGRIYVTRGLICQE